MKPAHEAAVSKKGWPRERLLSVTSRVHEIAASDAVPWLVVGVGAVLRLVRYFDDRSLWLDESFLALNIVGKSLTELMGPLDYVQSAPPGFLGLEKTVVTVLGDDEAALRLFPLVSGIAALLLFRSITARLLPKGPALLALTLFAVNEQLVYYSSEVKPYATDVAVATVLLYVFVRYFVDWKSVV